MSAKQDKKVPRLLTVDFGQKTGFAFNSFNGKRITQCGMKKLPDKRREIVYEKWLRLMLNAVKPEALIFEALVTWKIHKSGAASHWWGFYYHTAMKLCDEYGIPAAGVTPTELKAHATNYGKSGKVALIDAAVALGYNPVDDNAADALWLLLYAVDKDLVTY